MADVTELIDAAVAGDRHAADDLLPLVYDELRRLAAHRLAQEKAGATLEPTALVHEAYLRLVGGGSPGWKGRGHFFGAAARAMRHILVEEARRKRADKRGGRRPRVPLEEFHRIGESPEDVLDLDDALTRLAQDEPAKADLVQLRFFAGLTTAEAAETLGISVATAERWWSYARAWLYNDLQESRLDEPAH